MTGQAETRRQRRRIQRSRRSGRVRALLAGGLVLGVGASVTLAAWNDSEYASGSLTAGTFQLEGSTDGVDFSASDSSSPHSLSFSPASEPLFPGSTRYALFSVRSAEASLGGDVQVFSHEENTTGLGAHLTYGLSVIEGTACDADTFDAGTTLVEPGSALSVSPGAAQDLGADQTAPVNYCLELHLPSDAENEAQGQTAAPSWEFLGTSVSG